MGRVKSLRNGSGAAATAARAGAAVWACRPAAGEESAAALEQQRAMAAIRAIFRVWGCARWPLYQLRAINSLLAQARGGGEPAKIQISNTPSTRPLHGAGVLQTLNHFHVRTNSPH